MMPKIDIVVTGDVGAGKSAIVQLISATLMARGLNVKARLDDVRNPDQLTQVLKTIVTTNIFVEERQSRRTEQVDGTRKSTGYQPVPGSAAPPPPPKIQDVTVGDTWYARLKGASVCLTCIITDVTAKTVEFKSNDGYIKKRYPRPDVEFIELLTPHVSNVIADL
jgi:hypothetical protein